MDNETQELVHKMVREEVRHFAYEMVMKKQLAGTMVTEADCDRWTEDFMKSVIRVYLPDSTDSDGEVKVGRNYNLFDRADLKIISGKRSGIVLLQSLKKEQGIFAEYSPSKIAADSECREMVEQHKNFHDISRKMLDMHYSNIPRLEETNRTIAELARDSRQNPFLRFGMRGYIFAGRLVDRVLGRKSQISVIGETYTNWATSSLALARFFKKERKMIDETVDPAKRTPDLRVVYDMSERVSSSYERNAAECERVLAGLLVFANL